MSSSSGAGEVGCEVFFKDGFARVGVRIEGEIGGGEGGGEVVELGAEEGEVDAPAEEVGVAGGGAGRGEGGGVVDFECGERPGRGGG